ncbi:putative quinol monooxygenase [Ruegeria sp. HKCCD6604]|uniref:putative quinol monooxygenase n=1 Tax=Ruegeria sp. HKCCD6604 TaxID=2683000 RepID=UPI0014916CC3|nr:putative quinol monooxygenase [Ruegeria sp. HKCCD6604]NOC94250.1 antibiotic biosynthesis monooxygenase [Ruegeria sp. HKCCD6604]
MFAVTVTFTLKPGTTDTFLPLMVENASTSLREEPGCHQFDVCLVDDPETVFLYEVYEDAAAFGVHLESPHFKSFDAAVADMIEAKVVHQYSEVIR